MHHNNPYIRRVDALCASAPLNMSWQTLPEAQSYVRAIVQLKREIHLVKQQITAAKHQIHAQAVQQRGHVGKGFAGGASRAVFGAKNAGRANAAAKDHMREQELHALQPLEHAEQHIAQVLLGLDSYKVQLENWIAQNR